MSVIKHTLGALPAPSWHRPWFRYIDAVDGADAGTPAPSGVAQGEDSSAKPDEPLGAPGLAALKSEREAKAAAEKRAAAAEARIKEFENAQKTEAEKQAEALAEAKAELANLLAAKTRAEVAAAKGVPVELLAGSTQEELEASADALIAFRGEAQPQKLIVPNEGKSPENLPPAPQPGVPRLAQAFNEAIAKSN